MTYESHEELGFVWIVPIIVGALSLVDMGVKDYQKSQTSQITSSSSSMTDYYGNLTSANRADINQAEALKKEREEKQKSTILWTSLALGGALLAGTMIFSSK